MFQKSLHFKGKSQFDNKDYEMEIKLLKDVVPERTKYQIRPRFIEIVLEKMTEGPYWERLLEEKTKRHWLKIDFQKWKDENDSEDEAGADRLKENLKKHEDDLEDETGTDSFKESLKKMEGLMKDSKEKGGTKVEKAATTVLKKLEALKDPTVNPNKDLGLMFMGKLDEEKMRRLCQAQQNNSAEPDIFDVIYEEYQNKFFDLSEEGPDLASIVDIQTQVRNKLVGQPAPVPEFHAEYSRRFGGEKEHIKKLVSLQDIFKSSFSSPKMIEIELYHKIQEETQSMLLKRWGSNLTNDERFEQFFMEDPLHSIFEQKTENIAFNLFQFQSMKNHTIPEQVYEFGETHVSIGCVDFQQLLMGILDQSKGGKNLQLYFISCI